MSEFFESPLCKSGIRCRQCRRSRAYRKAIAKQFDDIDDVDFACPLGKTEDDFPQEVESSLVSQVRGLARAVKNEVKSANGQAVNIEERMEICRDCEFFLQLKNRCAKCGCFMKYKARLKSSKCPIGKW